MSPWAAFLLGAPIWGGLGVLTMALVAAGARGDGPACCGCCVQAPGKQLIPCQHCPRHGFLADRVGFSLVGLQCPYRPGHQWTDEAAPSVEGA